MASGAVPLSAPPGLDPGKARPSTSAQYLLCGQLDRHVRQLLQKHRFFDAPVRDARLQLRNSYVAVLLGDHALSQEKNLEQDLWHQVFYKCIIEFRSRLASSKAGGAKTSEAYAKTCTAFTKFLEDATAFYKALAYRLQEVYGSAGFTVQPREAGALDGVVASAGSTPSTTPSTLPSGNGEAGGASHLCRQSVYRCIVCLGDLARYAAPLRAGGSKLDFNPAAKFYHQATEVFPEGGNAFNQLAVLAALREDSLCACAYYARALLAPQPFDVALQNLQQVLDVNRGRHKALGAPVGVPTDAQRKGNAHLASLPDLLADLAPRYMHAMSIVINRTDLDDFASVFKGAVQDVQDLLSRPPVVAGPAGRGGGRSDAVLSHAAVLTLFAVHHTADGPAQVRQHAQEAACAFLGRLVQGVASHGNTGTGGLVTSPLLPLLNTLLGWLLANRQSLFGDVQGQETLAQHAATLWQALAELAVVAAAVAEGRGIPYKAIMTYAPVLLSNSPHAKSAPSDYESAGRGDDSARLLIALPEDRAVRGFAPVRAALQELRFTEGKLPQEEEAAVRLQRILRTLYALSEGGGSEAAMQPLRSFRATIAQLLGLAAEPVANQEAEHEAAAADDNENMEDAADEEVIVYNPGEAAAPATAAATHQLPTPTPQLPGLPPADSPHPPDHPPATSHHLPIFPTAAPQPSLSLQEQLQAELHRQLHGDEEEAEAPQLPQADQQLDAHPDALNRPLANGTAAPLGQLAATSAQPVHIPYANPAQEAQAEAMDGMQLPLDLDSPPKVQPSPPRMQGHSFLWGNGISTNPPSVPPNPSPQNPWANPAASQPGALNPITPNPSTSRPWSAGLGSDVQLLTGAQSDDTFAQQLQTLQAGLSSNPHAFSQGLNQLSALLPQAQQVAGSQQVPVMYQQQQQLTQQPIRKPPPGFTSAQYTQVRSASGQLRPASRAVTPAGSTHSSVEGMRSAVNSPWQSTAGTGVQGDDDARLYQQLYSSGQQQQQQQPSAPASSFPAASDSFTPAASGPPQQYIGMPAAQQPLQPSFSSHANPHQPAQHPQGFDLQSALQAMDPTQLQEALTQLHAAGLVQLPPGAPPPPSTVPQVPPTAGKTQQQTDPAQQAGAGQEASRQQPAHDHTPGEAATEAGNSFDTATDGANDFGWLDEIEARLAGGAVQNGKPSAGAGAHLLL